MSTRLKERDVRNHPLRASILREVSGRPGVTFLELHSSLCTRPEGGERLGFGSLGYHLHQLERHRILTSRRSGRHRRFYENGGAQGGLTDALAVLQTPCATRVARALLDAPGATQAGLWRAIRDQNPCTRQATGFHLARLEGQGLVLSGRVGRAKTYFATERLFQLIRLAAPSLAVPARTDAGSYAAATSVL